MTASFEKKVKELPKVIAEIMLSMLDAKNSPYRGREKVIEIVKQIYDADFDDAKDKADLICNLFAENGHFFLNDLYFEKNRT